jgi:Tfp pilus assembly protein PilF
MITIWDRLFVPFVFCFVLFVVLPLSIGQSLPTAPAAFDAGNYAQAVKSLMAALDQSPRDPSINYWLARSYYEQQDYDKAITHAEAAIQLAPQNAEYHLWLGRAYGGKAEKSHSFFLARKVKQAFETAVRLAPGFIQARRDLTQYLVEAPWIVGGDKAKAKEEIEIISRLDPVEGHLARASYWSADKKWNEAGAEYRAAVDQRPPRIEPYLEAAEFFAGRKDSDNLNRVVESARRVDSRDPRVDFYGAVVLILRRTQLPTAEKLLKSYIANVPPRSDYPSRSEAQKWLRMGN